MKKTNCFTKALAVFLTALMLLSVAPLGELAGLGLGFGLKADAVTGYSAGGAAKWAIEHYNDHDSVLLGTGYWNDGGDCANFVSQCLYMGGIDMDEYWNTTGYMAHWSELHGWEYAGSFIRCVQLYNFLVNKKGGQVIHNPSVSQVDIGDVLIYYRPEAGRFNHSAIVADIEGGVPKIAYHSVGWDHDFTTNWHLGFTGDQTYLIKLHGSVCVNQRTRSVDVYKLASGYPHLLREPNGEDTYHFFIENDYALVDEVRWVNGQSWGHTMLDAIWGWVPLKYFTYLNHYETPKVNHIFGVWQTIQVANCQQDGLDRRVCTRCGYTETRTTKGGHITDPHATCTTEGICKICGTVTENALGHIWDDGRVSKKPTCTEPGDMLYFCERDKAHQYTDRGVIPALGHDYQATATAPSCVQDGITTYVCSRCGDSYVTYTDENNTWSGWTTDQLDLPENKVRTMTQYRYRDKNLKDSANGSLEDWTPSDPAYTFSAWSNWSDWSETETTESKDADGNLLREVEKQYVKVGYLMRYYNYTDYSVSGQRGYYDSAQSGMLLRYGFYKGGSQNGHAEPQYFPVYDVDTRAVKVAPGAYTPNEHNGYGQNKSGQTGYFLPQWRDWNSSDFPYCCMYKDEEVWVWQYRYRDRTKTYHYYQWKNWSSWDETQPETTENREIESRTVYSYDLAALGHDFSVQQAQTFENRDMLLTEAQTNSTCYSYGYTCSRCGALAPDSVSVLHDIPDFETERDQYEIVSGDDASVTIYKGVCRNGCGCYVLKTVDNHNYVVKEIVPPTCNGENGTEGYTVYRCTFHGEEYNDDFVPALEDDYSHDVWEVQTTPTCTKPGVMICKCARFNACGHFKTKEIPPLGHTMTKYDAQNATCLLDGSTEYYYCSGCDKYYDDANGTSEIEENSWVIPATGHSDPKDVEWTVETQRKCGFAGYERKYCQNEWCDEKLTCDLCSDHGIHGAVIDERETEPIPADFYVFDSKDAVFDSETGKWISTTCDHPGILYYTCKNCEGTPDMHGFVLGDSYTPLELDPIDHMQPVTVEDPAAYCIYPGIRHTNCDFCGKKDIVSPETIPAPFAEHDLEQRQDSGCIYHVCTRCGYSPDTDAHDFQRDADRDVAPACLTDGKEAYTCSRCGMYDDKTLPALGHDPEKVGSLPATCTEGGMDAYACKREGCDFTYTVPVGQPLGHDDSGNYTVTKKASCTEDGSKVLTCVRVNARTGDVCNEELSKLKIPARGHNMSEWIDDSATGEDACRRKDCMNTETGEYEACTYSERENHVWGDWFDTGDGEQHSRTCETIDTHIQTQTHSWTKISAAEADCTNSGSILWRCEVCGAEKTEAVGPNGHQLVKTEAVSATCLEDGNSEYYTCTACGLFFADENAEHEIAQDSWVIEALGHDWGDWKEKTKATYDACGEEERICNRDVSHIETRPTPILTPESKENKDITVDKDAHYDAATGEATISLFAESKGKTIKSKDETPLDIVLVLDQSGSMRYEMDSNTLINNSEDSRLKNLKTAANSFVQKIFDNGNNNVDHRIAVVGFAMGGAKMSGFDVDGERTTFEAYENTNILSLPSPKSFDPTPANIVTMNGNYKNALVSVAADGQVNPVLTSAIDHLNAKGATAADLGLIMACKVFEQNPITDSNRRRVVVFMTDGEPTYSSGYQDTVANYAISNANLLKNAYDATVYSVGVVGSGISKEGERFMQSVATQTADGKKLFYKVTDSESFLNCFKNIAEESVKVENSFDDVTLVDTITKEFIMTETQEKALRLAAIQNLGVTNDDVSVLRFADGTTQIRIAHIHPKEVKRDGESYFPVNISFTVSADEQALPEGTYETNTDNAGVVIGSSDLFETTFKPASVEVESAEGVVYFNLNGRPFHAVRFHTGDALSAPSLTLQGEHTFAGWEIPDPVVFTEGKLVLDATLEQKEYTVTWEYDGGTKTDSYNEGDILTPSQIGLNGDGELFDGWDPQAPLTMPAGDQTFHAVYKHHTHQYERTTVKRASCGVEGIDRFVCAECQDSYEERTDAKSHKYTTFATDNNSGNKNFAYIVCENCGLTVDAAFTYRFEDATGKVQACDLSMKDLNSATIQPVNGGIQITLPIPAAMQYAKDIDIYRIETDGSKTDLDAKVNRNYWNNKPDSLTFITDHFSPYSIEATYECEISGEHDWDDGVVTENATCTQTGEKVYTCSLCETTRKETLQKLDHTPGVWIIDKAATCKEAGSKHRECTVCHNTIATETIAADKANHASYGTTLKNKVDANCTTKGYTGDMVCNGCGTVIKKGSETTALGHTAPNSKGNCDRCGTHLKDVDPGSSTPAGACKYCGQVHTGPFGWLIKFFHSILALFGLRK